MCCQCRRFFESPFFEASLKLAVLTGAGISTESGIPDFRSPGGIWSQMEPIQYQDFVNDQESRREDWRRRFEMKRIFDRAEPNEAHFILARLVREGRLECVITQNVDGLHQRSGIPDEHLIELHGNSTYAACVACGSRADLETQYPVWREGRTPHCTQCGNLLKAAVVSFGQAMPQAALEEAAELAESADIFIVIGSSLLVHPAAQLPVIAVQSGARLVIINRDETPLDTLAQTVIRTPIAKTFNALIPFA